LILEKKINKMKITPLEIRQKTFEKVFRGYEKDEVNAYLQSLSMEWERMLDENKELYLRIENLETESNKLRELESSLFKTLKTAEDTGATLIEQTKKETDLKIKESSLKAETILNDARSKAKSLIEQADERKKQVLDEMISKVKTLENLFNQMIDLKEKVVDQVKSYSTDLLDRIEKLEKRSEELQIKDIVSEAKHIYNSTSVGVTLDFLNNIQVVEENTLPDKNDKQEIEELEKTADPDENKETLSGKEEIEMEVEVSVEEETEVKKEIFFETDVTEQEEDLKEQIEKLPDEPEVKQEDSSEVEPESNTINGSEDEQPEIGLGDSEKVKKSTSTSFFDEID
jgi:cell division initiation protein